MAWQIDTPIKDGATRGSRVEVRDVHADSQLASQLRQRLRPPQPLNHRG